MKTPIHVIIPLFAAVLPGLLDAQAPTSSHIGYVYPSGGQQGTTFEVSIGGKGLIRSEHVMISGTGVHAEVIQHIGNYKRKLQEQMRVVKQQNSGLPNQLEKSKERKFGPPPDHEIFTRLEELSKQEFRQIAAKFQSKERVQRNREIDELLVLRITIDPNAKPGMRELRILSKIGGLTNPLRFMVNTLPEQKEYEPNDRTSPAQTHMQIPFIMNGQIMPGDEDWFSFDAYEGQQLVVSVKARDLVPYLADAVPGWFQAVVSVFNDSGKEVAYADDFLFNPDPTLMFEVPETGRYHISIRDSIFRGREDFVYRISVGEIPFVQGIFPLGGQTDSQTSVTAYGWNLKQDQFILDTTQKGGPIRRGFLRSGGTISNYVRYAVEDLPESIESEDNNVIENAQLIGLYTTVNGRIDQPGDIDYFRFEAKRSQVVSLSINARRLYSPLDSLLRVIDSEGNVLEWNDDMPHKGRLTDRTGLLTHNADSQIDFVAPSSGTYFVQVSDAQSKGGREYAYRLTLAEPNEDFEVYITPSAVTIPRGSSAMATLHVDRKNGYSGPIDVEISTLDTGYTLSGNHIPEGCDSLPIVIHRSKTGRPGIMNVNLVAMADVDGNSLAKRIIPADDITQAFITHHLVEARQFTIANLPTYRQLPKLAGNENGAAVITMNAPTAVRLNHANLPYDPSTMSFELLDAPSGVTMEASKGLTGTRLDFVATEKLPAGLEGNLVVAVYTEFTPKTKNEKSTTRKVAIGCLPAIPFRVE